MLLVITVNIRRLSGREKMDMRNHDEVLTLGYMLVAFIILAVFFQDTVIKLWNQYELLVIAIVASGIFGFITLFFLLRGDDETTKPESQR